MTQRILIIEDDAVARDALMSILSMEGYEVSGASDGEVALRALETSTPDLVITDLEMPALSGFRFIDAFRARCGDVPVIVVSGHDEPTYRVAGFDLGADDFLAKPIDSNELLARVQHHLRRAERQQAVLRQSQSDELTGMLNRRGITSFCQRAMQSAKSETPISIAVVDVDDFKAINDRFGHATGDNALAVVACALQDSVRATDRVGRVGGDEFLIVLPGADASHADEIVQRLRARLPIELLATGRAVVQVQLSIGCATLGAAESLASAIERADAAMYQQKRAGRA